MKRNNKKIIEDSYNIWKDSRLCYLSLIEGTNVFSYTNVPENSVFSSTNVPENSVFSYTNVPENSVFSYTNVPENSSLSTYKSTDKLIVSEDNHIIRYLYDENIIKEICTFMYSNIKIKKLPFLNEYMKYIWYNLEKYCYRYNINFYHCEELYNFDQLLNNI